MALMTPANQVIHSGNIVEVLMDSPGDATLDLDQVVLNETIAKTATLVVNGSPRTITGLAWATDETDIVSYLPQIAASNKLRVRLTLDQVHAEDRVQFDDTVGNLTLPEGVFTLNGVPSALQVKAITNDSFQCADEHDRIADDCVLAFVSDDGNDETAITYTKATLPNVGNTKMPGAVLAFATVRAAQDAARGQTNINIGGSRHSAVLMKVGSAFGVGYDTTRFINLRNCGGDPSNPRTRPAIITWYSDDGEIGDVFAAPATLMYAYSLGARGGVTIDSGFLRFITRTSGGHVQLSAPISSGPDVGVLPFYYKVGMIRYAESNTGMPTVIVFSPTEAHSFKKATIHSPIAESYAYSSDASAMAFGSPSPYANIEDVEFWRPVLKRHNGDDDGREHEAYLKGLGAFIRVAGGWTRESSGAAGKYDGISGLWVHDGIKTACAGMNVEANGAYVGNTTTPMFPVKTDRSEPAAPYLAGQVCDRPLIQRCIWDDVSTGIKFQSVYKGGIVDCLVIANDSDDYVLLNANDKGSSGGGTTPSNADVGETHGLIIKRITGVGGSGLSINPALGADITLANNVGFHGVKWVGCLISTKLSTDRAIRVLDTTWEATNTAGLSSGQITQCNFYGGVFRESERVSNITYATLAEAMAGMPSLFGSGNTSVDPQYVNGDARLLTYAMQVGHITLDSFWDAIIEGMWTRSLPSTLTERSIAAFMLAAFTPQNPAVVGRGTRNWTLGTTATPALRLASSTGGSLATTVNLSYAESDTPAIYSYRIYSDNASFDCADLDNTPAGVASIHAWRRPDGTEIDDIAEYTITAGSYVTVEASIDIDTAGAAQSGSINHDGGSAGDLTFQVSVSVSDGVDLQIVNSQGAVISGDIELPSTIQGTPSSLVVGVKNAGSSNGTIGVVSIDGDFEIGDDDPSGQAILVGETLFFTIRATAISSGDAEGTLSITSDDDASPLEKDVTCEVSSSTNSTDVTLGSTAGGTITEFSVTSPVAMSGQFRLAVVRTSDGLRYYPGPVLNSSSSRRVSVSDLDHAVLAGDIVIMEVTGLSPSNAKVRGRVNINP